MAAAGIHVKGLREYRRALKRVNADLPKAMRLALNEAANVIVDDARPRVPSRTGTARASVKARSTQTTSRVAGGGNKAPYYPWLDFGGTVRGYTRPFFKEGRYIYRAYYDNRSRYEEVLVDAVVEVARQGGIEVVRT